MCVISNILKHNSELNFIFEMFYIDNIVTFHFLQSKDDMEKEMIKNFIKAISPDGRGDSKCPHFFQVAIFPRKKDLDLWFFTVFFGDLEGVGTLTPPL